METRSHLDKRSPGYLDRIRSDLPRETDCREGTVGAVICPAWYEPSLIADRSKKKRKFNAWVRALRKLGYDVTYGVRRSADYGDPTIRQRLFVLAVDRSTGRKNVWPQQTHAQPDKEGNVPEGLLPWRTARDSVIDWSLEGDSIWERELQGKKDLVDKTFSRVVHGWKSYGLKEFFVPKDRGWDGENVRSVDLPCSTITANHRGEALVTPYMVAFFGSRPGQEPRTVSIDSPMHTVECQRRHGLVSPFLIQMMGTSKSHPVDIPLNTVLNKPKHFLMEPYLLRLKGTGMSQGIRGPLAAICAGGIQFSLVEGQLQPFQLSIDQTGSNGGCTRDIDSPLPTLVTKANQVVVSPTLRPLTNVHESHTGDGENIHGAPHGAPNAGSPGGEPASHPGTPGSDHGSIDADRAGVRDVRCGHRAGELRPLASDHSSGAVPGEFTDGDRVQGGDSSALPIASASAGAVVVREHDAPGSGGGPQGTLAAGDQTPANSVFPAAYALWGTAETDRGSIPGNYRRGRFEVALGFRAEPDQASGDPAVVLGDAFLVGTAHDGVHRRVHPTDRPLPTVCGHRGEFAVVTTGTQGVKQLPPGKLEPCVGNQPPEGCNPRVWMILEPLIQACHGRDPLAVFAGVKPWIYTYYSSGGVGGDIDAPLPTVRSHDGVGLVQPRVRKVRQKEVRMLKVQYPLFSDGVCDRRR